MRTRRYRKRGGNGENTNATQPPASPGIFESLSNAAKGVVETVQNKAAEFQGTIQAKATELQEGASSVGDSLNKNPAINTLKEGVENGFKQAQVMTDGFLKDDPKKEENVAGGRRRKSKRKKSKRRTR